MKTRPLLWQELSLLTGLILCGFTIAPMLGLKFIGDDVQASWLVGYFAWEHVSVASDIWHNVHNWIVTEGRFFPVAYIYIEYFFSNPHLVAIEKPVQLVAVVANALTLYAVVRKFSTHALAMLAVLCFATTLQIRFWYDPIVGYFIMLPVAVESVLLSILLWTVAYERESRPLAALALLIEALGLLVYEQTYAIFAAAAVASWFVIPGGSWKRAVPALVSLPIAIMVVVDIVLRSHVAFVATDPYSTHFTGGPYFRTFLEQLAGALPLSYWLFRPIPGAIPTLGTLGTFVNVSVIASSVLAFVLGFLTFDRLQPARGRATWPFIGFGFALWILPAAIISLSPRWQAETVPGLAYLNVYIEFVGVAILLTIFIPRLLHWLSRRWSSSFWVRITAALCLSLVVFVSATVNSASCSAFTPIYTNGRINLDGAFRHGIAAQLPEGATIILSDGSYLFFFPSTKYILFEDSGRKFAVASGVQLAIGALCANGRWDGDHCDALPNVWEYRSTTPDTHAPWVQLARARTLHRDAAANVSILTDRWFVYTTPDLAQRVAGLREAQPGSTENGPGIYRDTGCLGMDTASLSNQDFPYVDFGPGFYPPEHDTAARDHQLFHWTIPQAATMIVHRPPLAIGDTTIMMTLRSLSTGRATITAGTSVVHVRTSPKEVTVRLPLAFGVTGTEAVQLGIVGGPFTVPGDPRQLGLQVTNLDVSGRCQK